MRWMAAEWASLELQALPKESIVIEQFCGTKTTPKRIGARLARWRTP